MREIGLGETRGKVEDGVRLGCEVLLGVCGYCGVWQNGKKRQSGLLRDGVAFRWLRVRVI